MAVRIYVVGDRISVYTGTFEWKDFHCDDFSQWSDVLECVGDRRIAYVRWL